MRPCQRGGSGITGRCASEGGRRGGSVLISVGAVSHDLHLSYQTASTRSPQIVHFLRLHQTGIFALKGHRGLEERRALGAVAETRSL